MIKKIISGGQTGVDRAALDIAIALNFPHSGWCPKGRKAEDGLIPAKYQLQETPSPDYSERTAWNVRDSDGTLIICQNEIMGGTLLTMKVAQQLKKSYFIFDVAKRQDIKLIKHWLKENQIYLLNIAGPRESQSYGIYQLAFKLLQNLLMSKESE